jgi:hypothetical protein
MGFYTGVNLKCHTCKRQQSFGGTKKTGNCDEAKRKGWLFLKNRVDAWVWLCPACARKHQRHPIT